MQPDLLPTAERVAHVVAAIADDDLGRPTPCPDYTVADLLDHVNGLSLAFELAATKANGDDVSGPAGDGSRLPDDWRRRIPEAVQAMAVAWQAPESWTGMTQAGGVDLPGEVAGLVALDELLIHGWDLARATGQPYDADEANLSTVHAFLTPDADAPAGEGGPDGLFGPPVPVPVEAPLLERAVGLAGRDPSWSPS